ncbi:unnamed protein product [Clavelina lepadiformis]|uniref:JmjC domain-containing protein n=1 Tax=Clavelina lepadiformis TaxID=159417 RepID=A0ABP0GFQ5_CLALP
MSLKILLLQLCVKLIVASVEEINAEALQSHPGHLLPLGSVGPYFELPVLHAFPQPREFFNKYVVPSIPVLMKGAVQDAPAFHKWSDDYFLDHAGSNETVFVENRKKENRTTGGFEIPFHDYIKNYLTEDIYMVNGVPQFLRPDIELPAPLQCSLVMKSLTDAVMWFSSGGTKSVLHNDDLDNVNCLYRGKKQLVFINTHELNNDWIRNVIDHPGNSYSDVDVDAVDYVKYHSLANTKYAVVNMTAGDCLFIPTSWYHQVNSHGNNLAVNIWFTHLPRRYVDLSEEKCGKMHKITLDKCIFEKLDISDKTEQYTFGKNTLSLPNSAELSILKVIYQFVKRNISLSVEDLQSGLSNLKPNFQMLKSLIMTTTLQYAVEIMTLLDVNKDAVIDGNDFAMLRDDIKLLETVVGESDAILDEYLVAVDEIEEEDRMELTRMLFERGDLSYDDVVEVYGKEFVQSMKRFTGLKQEL